MSENLRDVANENSLLQMLFGKNQEIAKLREDLDEAMKYTMELEGKLAEKGEGE